MTPIPKAFPVWYKHVCSRTSYRRPRSRSEACDYIRGLAGSHLDPAVVAAFLRMQDSICPGQSR